MGIMPIDLTVRGLRVYDVLVRVKDLDVAIKTLVAHDIKCVCAYIYKMECGEVGELLRSKVDAEKARRWDAAQDKGERLKEKAKLTARGGTMAEGFEAAHRGEEV